MDGWDQDRISVQTLTQNELLNNIIPSLFFAFFFLSNNNVKKNPDTLLLLQVA